jgi:hypothetical protein
MTRWCFALALVAGCSFSLSGPDPRRPAHTNPVCDTTKNLVVIDGLLATSAFITTAAVGGQNAGAAVVAALVGAAFVAGAWHGNSAVDDCRKANAEYFAEVNEAPSPPAPPPPPREIAVAAPQPPPAPAPVAAPAPPPPSLANEPWAAFWKEVR